MEIPFRKDDQVAILAAVGPVIPVLVREAVDDGFHNFKRSRDLDPIGFADYSSCSRMNMLYDRIMASARELIDAAKVEVPGLSWRIGDNKRPTEIMLEPLFAFRIKRVKDNRGGLSTGVDTGRRLRILSETLPVGQMILEFPGFGLAAEDRIWLTGAYDLDVAEESVSRVSIGIETKKNFLWKCPILEAVADVIAKLPNSVADRIGEMRARRSA